MGIRGTGETGTQWEDLVLGAYELLLRNPTSDLKRRAGG